MLTPKQRRCSECAQISTLLDEIDCRLSKYGIGLFNNITLMLNKNVPMEDILDLLVYKRVLQYKSVNSEYACSTSILKIASKVKRLVRGCKPVKPCCMGESKLTTTTTSTIIEVENPT